MNPVNPANPVGLAPTKGGGSSCGVVAEFSAEFFGGRQDG